MASTTRMSELAWYYATSERVTFGFETHRGVVVATAPYARRWLIGLNVDEAIERLRAQGYAVVRGDRASV